MNIKKTRDIVRLICSILFIFLYIPHLLIYFCSKRIKKVLNEDISNTGTDYIHLPNTLGLLFLLHNNRYFRTLYYYRIGPIAAMLMGWWRPGDRYFIISKTTQIGPGVKISHPYATIINAESIGRNFSCIHCTTLGSKGGNRPVLGDCVTLGANVTIIGGVHIGNNVTIGAGSVVVKDIPNDAIAVGNPAKVIKYNK